MPRHNKKNLKVRRRPRKHRRKTRLGKPSRALTASIYQFKRTMTEVIQVSNGTDGGGLPTGWTADGFAIYKQFVFTLEELPNYTEFTALFASYKVCAAKMEIYFSNSNTVDTNSRLLLYYDNNPQGETTALTEQHYLETQTARKRLVATTSRSPIRFYTKLKQLSTLYHRALPTPLSDYGMVYPRYVSTSEPTTPHYGFNLRIQNVANTALSGTLNNFQTMKINTTLYITCKRVQ